MEEAFYWTVHFYDRLPRATSKFAARNPQTRGKMTDLPKFAARMLRGAAFQRLGGFS